MCLLCFVLRGDTLFQLPRPLAKVNLTQMWSIFDALGHEKRGVSSSKFERSQEHPALLWSLRLTQAHLCAPGSISCAQGRMVFLTACSSSCRLGLCSWCLSGISLQPSTVTCCPLRGPGSAAEPEPVSQSSAGVLHSLLLLPWVCAE